MLISESVILKLSPRQEDRISQAVVAISEGFEWRLRHMPTNSIRGTTIRSSRSQRKAIRVW